MIRIICRHKYVHSYLINNKGLSIGSEWMCIKCGKKKVCKKNKKL